MNAPRPSFGPSSLRCLLLCLVAALCAHTAVSRADDPPKPPPETELRAAITKSLGYLAKGSDQWMADKNCNACHHLPQVLWNHREAKRRGFPVDPKQFDAWLTWSESNAKNISAGREMTAFMKLALPEKPAPELTQIIVKGQLPDGSWKPGGQFIAQRREAHEVTANSARIFLLALGTQAADQEITEQARTKAAALLGKNEPEKSEKSVETLAYRTLYAQRFGKPEEVATLRAELLKLQHADGGWAWLISESQSDSIATGLTLFALQPSAEPTVAGAITRAQRWLLGKQADDGGWPVDLTRISKGDRSAPAKAKSLRDATMIYSYWGTAWSTLGLLQAVPVQP